MNNMVSGSIVTFNNISTIEKTLETIFTQTKDIDFKLYIVDNGSSDGTPEFVENNFPQVSVIRNEKNVGFGAGHNIIINSVESSYHAIINPDIVLKENVIKKMVDYMEENQDIGLLSPRICFPMDGIRYSANAIRGLNISLQAGLEAMSRESYSGSMLCLIVTFPSRFKLKTQRAVLCF